MVGARAIVAVFALYKGVSESGDVAGGFPDFGAEENGGVYADYVITIGDECLPPQIADVVF